MVSIEQLDYTRMDMICFRCEHPWKEHYEKGCLHVINKEECEYFGANIKYCACLESVNRHHYNHIVFDVKTGMWIEIEDEKH